MEKTNIITEILEAFKIFDGNYKREQVDAAIELKEEITPFLIEILENVLLDPDTYIQNDDRYDHIYSLMLLGHFRESKAHNIIIDLFSLPGNTAHELFGDLATSDLPTILIRTCGGSIELIKSMASNKDADDYCRVSALNAMAYAVVEKIVSREEVISFFGTLFTGDETDEFSDFWSLLANLVCDLYPEEIMDTIKKAYDDDLIASGMIRYEDFKKALEDGKEKCLEELKADLERRSLDDIHDSMSWWACFNKKSQFFSTPDGLKNNTHPTNFDQLTHKLKKKKHKAKKKKRKQAKASKRKNRR
ncbi:MAG: DUF1186 domain-containing protein [bacterium]|nr:MAG: DUF1186 domain-containing protein [bacterium]